MRRTGFILAGIVVLTACGDAPAKEPSAADDARPVEEANLTTLGKVWGFAKYHHPRIAGGELDWDRELLDVIPEVMEAPSRDSALAVMTRWLEEAGPVEACGPCATVAADPVLPAPVDWIRDAVRLGPELSAVLVEVYENRSVADVQRYVAHQRGVGNPRFDDEEAYADEAAPDAELRLLALYRLWNILVYWFPYRDLMDDDLDELLAEFVPEVLEASDGESYRRVMLRLIARAKDTHANLWSDLAVRPPGGALRVPVSLRFVEDRAVVFAYAHPTLGPASGLRIGDVVIAVDGTPVDDLVEEWSPYYAASNPPTRLRDLARGLLRGDGPSVALTIERDGETLETTAERVAVDSLDPTVDRVHDRPGETFQLLSPQVAYLKLSSVVADSAVSYVERAQGTDVFVIDIRNYPSEFVVFALGQHLVPRPTPFARFTSASAANPGAFTMGDPISLPSREPFYEGRVVILVDEVSQSQAEYTTMAFRVAPDALVAGSTTAGADGNVSPIPLPGGLRGMISGIGIFYPDGTPTQRVGIVPDVVVTPTIAGIREGRDEVLEAGVAAALGAPYRVGG